MTSTTERTSPVARMSSSSLPVMVFRIIVVSTFHYYRSSGYDYISFCCQTNCILRFGTGLLLDDCLLCQAQKLFRYRGRSRSPLVPAEPLQYYHGQGNRDQ